MGVRELEVLLALCRAAPSVSSLQHAERLLHQLGPYLVEAHLQSFRASPFLRNFQPSPWELLVHDLTYAILSLSSNHETLRTSATSFVKQTVSAYAEAGTSFTHTRRHGSDHEELEQEQASTSIKFMTSILGFLNALSERPGGLGPIERYNVVVTIHDVLSEQVMTDLEMTAHRLRNSSAHLRHLRPWKRLVKVYASHEQPLGAVLLQRAFMHCVASCTSLFITPSEKDSHGDILEFVLSRSSPLGTFAGHLNNAQLETLTNLIINSLGLLEHDVDVLHIRSVWQEGLACSMKSNALISYLCCSLVDESIADSDLLMSWLEAVIADPMQLADDELAQTSLKCMAVLAKTSRIFASSLGRSLPRLIVQSKMTPETATVAADCLARVLLLLPQDMRISTLYSLGNVLSVGADPSRNLSMSMDGRGSIGSYAQHNQGSAISLVTSDVEETAAVHGTVVQAIVRIATRCDDEKITALALSMLVQKLGRAGTTVDFRIIQGSAELGLRGSANDLKPLLRLYSRVCYDALISGNNAMLQTVMDLSLIHI